MSNKWSRALSLLALSFLTLGLASLVVQFMALAPDSLTPGGPLQKLTVEVRTGLLNADSLFLPGMFTDIFEKGGQFADWYRPRASFFFPDYAIFGLAYWLAPNLFGQVMLYAVFQTLLVVAAVWLIARAAVGTGAAVVTAVVSSALLWLALNAGQPFVYLLGSVFHYGAFLVSLSVAGLWLLLHDPARPGSRPMLYAVLCLLVFAGAVSNSMFIIFCVIPLAATSFVVAVMTRDFQLKRQLPLVCVLTAGVLGYVVDMWATSTPGAAGSIDLARISSNFTAIVVIFRNAIDAFPPLAVLWLAYLGVVFYSLSRLRDKHSVHQGAHWLAVFSFMVLACSVSVFTLVTYLWPPQTRYYTPAVTWPFIVVAVFAASYWRRMFMMWATAGSAVAALSLAFGTYALAKGHELGTHYYPPEVACIDDALESTGLRNGLAYYWDARMAQSMSRLDLNIAQYSQKLGPVHWITSKRYFKPRYDFAILSDYAGADQISVETLLRLNGQPEKIVSCGISSVYLYGKDKLRINKLDAVGDSYRWEACELPSAIGEKTASCRIRKRDVKQAGPLSYGPYEPLPAGRYAFEIHYTSTASSEKTVADWDVLLAHATNPVSLAGGKMPGSEGAEAVIRGEFTVDPQLDGRPVEIRTLAHPDVDLESIELRLQRLP